MRGSMVDIQSATGKTACQNSAILTVFFKFVGLLCLCTSLYLSGPNLACDSRPVILHIQAEFHRDRYFLFVMGRKTTEILQFQPNLYNLEGYFAHPPPLS